jgi:Family of unknown function (DUF6445)
MRDINIFYHGAEREPVLVIDNFVPDPARLIEDAAMLSFRAIGIHYPGIRAEVPTRLARSFIAGLEDQIADLFGVAINLAEIESCYSLATTKPADLTPIQRLPHFDGVEPERLALLHFLGHSEEGGTSFYRHRSTGFETISAGRLDRYRGLLEQEIAKHGLPEPAYISGDTDLFEHIGHYAARFNRAILYRGNTLHCASIPAGMTLSSDPQRGRLTVNTFLNGARPS